MKSDLHDTVQVFCRLRPIQDERELPLIKLISPTTLATSTESKSKSLRKDLNYVFRHVFSSYSSQQDVFKHVGLPLLEDLINAKNGLLFTYGVTGSGKTYTLTGDALDPGIVPLCIHTLFNSIGDKQARKYLIKSDHMNGFELQSESEILEDERQETRLNNKRLRTNRKITSDKVTYKNEGIEINSIDPNSIFSVFVSYTEIYNNLVYDLLDESNNNKTVQTKIIREDSRKNMYVNGMAELEVKSAEEAFEIFNLGQKRRRMAHTQLNAESSRSHSIFNIRIVQLVKNMNGTEIPSESCLKVGQLSLVDLAGSERSNRTNNTGIRLKEASSINNSLMTLRSCMDILRENQKLNSNKVVPYRGSRLTLLFKNYFDGEGQVRMIVCINPSKQDYEENLQVLKFAEMTQEVQVMKPQSNYVQLKTPNIKTPKTPRYKATPRASSKLPRIPSIKLNLTDLEALHESLCKLQRCLQVRKQKAPEIKNQCKQMLDSFRQRLVIINNENDLLKFEVKGLNSTLRRDRVLSQTQNNKIALLESRSADLVSENCALEELIEDLKDTIDEKNLKIGEDFLKQKELIDKLERQRCHVENEMFNNDFKFKKVDDEHLMTVDEGDINENIQKHSVAITRQDDVWLEHNFVKPVAVNTPSIRKRKCVDVLSKATNVTNAKQSKDCLLTQELVGDEHVETKLRKGEEQVIFNGVEEPADKVPPSSNK
ncbi:hypothetical protein FQR65_LT01891 [Abscondita terminalis]|nr:hypothetical protein FQR65_LT01891 [Abscondita terminalis]